MINYRFESWRDFMADGDKLFPLHWEEMALDKESIKPAADHERYIKLDDMGLLQVTTARTAGRLIGYAINFLMVHMHYKESGLMAMADMYFILPDFRNGGCGVRLFAEMEKGLKARGVVRAHMSCKVHQDHQELFEKMGWRFTDKTFSKMLKAAE